MGDRIQRRTKVFLALVAFASSILSAMLLFGSTGISVHDWVKRTFDWRDHEYEKLASLHAGYTLTKFEEELGSPIFDRASPDGRFREQTFRRREHWVQTITTADGSVMVYAVTTCGHRFQPTFRTYDLSVTLNSSTFSDVSNGVRVNYFGSGATANSRFYDVLSAGNPSNYKTFIWGINDVCSDWFDDLYPAISLRASEVDPSLTVPIYRGALDGAPQWVSAVRDRFKVNTYAETAPDFYVGDIPRSFQVGADRILTRTVGD